jgi:hypothetical protein
MRATRRQARKKPWASPSSSSSSALHLHNLLTTVSRVRATDDAGFPLVLYPHSHSLSVIIVNIPALRLFLRTSPPFVLGPLSGTFFLIDATLYRHFLPTSSSIPTYVSLVTHSDVHAALFSLSEPGASNIGFLDHISRRDGSFIVLANLFYPHYNKNGFDYYSTLDCQTAGCFAPPSSTLFGLLS